MLVLNIPATLATLLPAFGSLIIVAGVCFVIALPFLLVRAIYDALRPSKVSPQKLLREQKRREQAEKRLKAEEEYQRGAAIKWQREHGSRLTAAAPVANSAE